MILTFQVLVTIAVGIAIARAGAAPEYKKPAFAPKQRDRIFSSHGDATRLNA